MSDHNNAELKFIRSSRWSIGNTDLEWIILCLVNITGFQ